MPNAHCEHSIYVLERKKKLLKNCSLYLFLTHFLRCRIQEKINERPFVDVLPNVTCPQFGFQTLNNMIKL